MADADLTRTKKFKCAELAARQLQGKAPDWLAMTSSLRPQTILPGLCHDDDDPHCFSLLRGECLTG